MQRHVATVAALCLGCTPTSRSTTHKRTNQALPPPPLASPAHDVRAQPTQHHLTAPRPTFHPLHTLHHTHLVKHGSTLACGGRRARRACGARRAAAAAAGRAAGTRRRSSTGARGPHAASASASRGHPWSPSGCPCRPLRCSAAPGAPAPKGQLQQQDERWQVRWHGTRPGLRGEPASRLLQVGSASSAADWASEQCYTCQRSCTAARIRIHVHHVRMPCLSSVLCRTHGPASAAHTSACLGDVDPARIPPLPLRYDVPSGPCLQYLV